MKVKIQTLIVVICAFLSFKSVGQNDSLNSFLKRDVLGIENLGNIQDSLLMKVVSASRSAKYIEDLPVTIYVITHKEIQQNNYTTLADALKHVPGVRVSQPGSGETGEIFQFRGLIGNYYTKILINNLPIKPSVVNGMPLGAQLPIRQAERIEIIFGPAAAIYGADAVTGVINIITKKANKGTFAYGDISLGEYEYNYINFMIGGKAGKNKGIMQYSFYGSKTEFNSMNIKSTEEDVYNPLYYMQKKGQTINLNGTAYQPILITDEILESNGISENDFISKYYPKNYEGAFNDPLMEEIPAASHQIGFEIKVRGISFAYNNMYRKAHSSLGRSTYLYKYNNPQNYWGEKIQRTVIGFDKKWEKFASSSHMSVLSYRMDNNSSYGLTYSDKINAYIYSASDDVFAEQLLTFTPVSNLEIVAGASLQFSGNLPVTNYLNKPFNSNNYEAFMETSLSSDTTFGDEFGFNPITFYNTAAFLQFYYVLQKLTIMGGLRYDNHSVQGSYYSPRIAILYKLGKRTSVTASYGKAYLAPSSSMAYQSFAYSGGVNNDSVYYVSIPNKNLNQEEFTAYEFAIRRKFWKRVYVDLSMFYNEIGNLIVDTYIPINDLDPNKYPRAIAETDSSVVRTKVNMSDVQSTLYGVQANIKFKDLIESVKLNIELNLMFNKKSETKPDVGSIVGSFELMPNHIGQLRISFEPIKKMYVQFDNVWMSKWLRVLIPFEEIYDDPYESVSGYYTLDALINYNLSDKLRIYGRFSNIFDEKYGGINATGTDADLPYNPQFGSSIRVGLTYNFN